MRNNTGGPAFPCEVVPQYDGMVHEGMTLRDYFAAKAMQGLLAAWTHGVPEASAIAPAAYQYADSMLKAREA